MAFWLVIGLAIASVALNFLLRPKVKAPKPGELTDLDNPTTEAGRPVPVVFGTVTVKGLNVLWYGEKLRRTRKVKA
jgi:hypothetical protein